MLFGFLLSFPFLLSFSVFYALLRKTKVLGQGDVADKINVVVSLVAAFYVMAYTPVGLTVGEFLSTYFTQTTMAVITLIGTGMVFVVATTAFGIQPGQCFKGSTLLALAFIGIGVVIFFTSGGPQLFGAPVGGGFGLTDEDVFFLVLMGITVLTIALVSGWKPSCGAPGQGQRGGQG